ncbi:transcription initiation factor TFIID subunit 9B isoform X1 [Marmota monax]|uniref:Transcription initiation factor TFIID subunit 9B n=1 Tax=Marmota monax TaxID=9995 RepID=A0A5E4CQA8_MARMO|nr:transcription initiation factor TFIID subunit 9B isoform X1 [Ictidomys tridecemlineatus]XP_015362997.1 transcription initiation factor TFIID subunit 9B isoform X1 [Marmota marmota marmota]XP_027786612.1 transcription initiation factor TFIID subunit 9B [Marmota flaviventris]XP_046277501.1 transcription initiation factor TFIID subunit 9B isoform X1 [Marmota monax]KAF7469783.1 transcription initiation factor TFIID subunit 9B [Marmota monax]KAG3272466.1 TATA-box binding protein associated facto
MESGKMAPPKNAPRDALVMAQILKDMGITEYEPRVINQMLEFAFRYVTTILDDAKIYSSHAKKPNVDADDVRLAIQCRADQSFTSPPPRDFLLDIARQKNQTPLPLIKPYSGPRLPPDRYCLTAPNYRLKSLIKKGSNQGRLVPRLSVGTVSSRPTTPTIDEKTEVQKNLPKENQLVGDRAWIQSQAATPQTVSVPNKVATPVSVTSQRFTVQIPPSQSTPVKPVPATTAVQNVLINPSMIGPKNILITTNMVSSQNTGNESNPMKRKHEDDDDNDTM